MKILLITTGENKNPGDQFIRLGVESLIREVWSADRPGPELVRVDKESDEIGVPQEFDRAILCGMPLWWNNDVSKSQDIGWWGPIMRGWVSDVRRKFLVLGAGPVAGAAGYKDPVELNAAVAETCTRAWAVTSRQPIAAPGVIESICPAAFAIRESHNPKWRHLCNFMPEGAHYAHFDPRAAEEWQRILPHVASELRDTYDFVAHSPDEVKLAKMLGWRAPRIHFPKTPESLLMLYDETRRFFGNRLHGAMAVAASGGTAVAVGYDSRMEMLRPFTPHRWSPFGVPLPGLAGRISLLEPGLDRARVARERVKNRELVRAFLFSS